MKNKNYSTPQYQLFCRIVCPALILLGLVLLVISIRTSQFTCQRSTGICTITHSGILPTPKISIELGYVGRVLVETTDGCCHSGAPQWSNLTIESGRLDKSYRLLYAWVMDETALANLYRAADQFREFQDDPTIPELTIRLIDNRQEDFFCGLYFLIAGLIYTLINVRVIFPGYQEVPSTAALIDNGTVESGDDYDGGQPASEAPAVIFGEPQTNGGRFENFLPLWLWWALVPAIGAIVFYEAFFRLTSFAYSLIRNTGYENVDLSQSGFSWVSIVFANILLAYIIAKVWITDRKEPRGFPSTAARIFCTIALIVLGIIFFILEGYFFWEFSLFAVLLVFVTVQAWAAGRLGMNGYGWAAASISGVAILLAILFLLTIWSIRDYYWTEAYYSGMAYSQGRFSILGFILGSLLSIIQHFVLKQRVAHASWWVLGNALTCEALFVIPALAVALFPQLQNWWEMATNQVFSSLVNLYLTTLVILISFSALQGAVLLWMVRKDPVETSPIVS